jgi:7-cyano-7-deazaguanine reductase
MARSSSLRAGRALPRATLGRRRTTPFTYAPRLLEAVPLSLRRGFAGQELWVALRCLRFTSLCPVTGQPDWATITINYLPRAKLVESKSLKEYLGSFRMHGDFHEDVCRIVCDDLVQLLAPRYLEVIGRFDTRGSIAIWPYAQWADPQDPAMRALLATRRDGFAPGRWDGREPSADG